MQRSGSTPERIDRRMFKNQNSIRLETEETCLMQARLYFPRDEIGNRFWKDANRPHMNVRRPQMWRYHGVRIVHEDYTIKGIDTIYEDGKTSTRSQHQGLRL